MTAPRMANSDIRPYLAAIIHDAAHFCASGDLTRADCPSGGIGMK